MHADVNVDVVGGLVLCYMQGFAVLAAGGGGLPAVSPGSQGEDAMYS